MKQTQTDDTARQRPMQAPPQLCAVRAEQIADPSRTIVQGTILEGVLETAINTDLPGAIRAVLTEDVVSYDGSTTLLPRGTRLIGSYSSNVKIAQRRALIAWNRAVTPAGTSVALGGTVTGEHGVGIEKLASMCVQFSPEERAQMTALKLAFDPKGLLNPGKLRSWYTAEPTAPVEAPVQTPVRQTA